MQNSYREINRIKWVDIARGICIIAIILDHTESYYINAHVLQYNWYVCNSLSAFYFLSGYLLFNKKNIYNKTFFIYKINRIFRTLVVPYFLFTFLMALPKAYIHHEDIFYILLNIVLGKASWFINALIIAELLFISILVYCKNKYIFLTLFSLFGSLVCTPINKFFALNIWCFVQTLLVFVFLYLGFLYHQLENKIHNVRKPFIIIIFVLIFLISKIIVENTNLSLCIYPLYINNIPFFLIDSIIGIILIVGISQLISNNILLEFTGKVSI